MRLCDPGFRKTRRQHNAPRVVDRWKTDQKLQPPTAYSSPRHIAFTAGTATSPRREPLPPGTLARLPRLAVHAVGCAEANSVAPSGVNHGDFGVGSDAFPSIPAYRPAGRVYLPPLLLRSTAPKTLATSDGPSSRAQLKGSSGSIARTATKASDWASQARPTPQAHRLRRTRPSEHDCLDVDFRRRRRPVPPRPARHPSSAATITQAPSRRRLPPPRASPPHPPPARARAPPPYSAARPCRYPVPPPAASVRRPGATSFDRPLGHLVSRHRLAAAR